MRKGCVYLVGAGPGDPGLVTLRAMELITGADVIVYDRLIPEGLLDHARADAELIYAGKHHGHHCIPQQQINQLLVQRARSGMSVVRLKGGDPFVFGRGGEEALELVEAGVPFEIVPGVTASVATAAYAGIPVTHRGVASSLNLVTGHESPEKTLSHLDFHSLANSGGTLAFYMGVTNLGSICSKLIDNGLDPQTPAAAIRWGTTSRQQVITATVETLPGVAKQSQLKPPAMILIGDVVRLREKLQWFESRPLFGRRIVVPRTRREPSKLASQLRQLGAEVIELPTIRDDRPDYSNLSQVTDLLAAGEIHWMAFPNSLSVQYLFAEIPAESLGNRVCLASIGPTTTATLRDSGLEPTIEAKDQSIQGLIVAILGQGV